MMILAPSLLAADCKELGKEIAEIEEHGARYLHYDVMDGMFVPSLSFGPDLLRSIRPAVHGVCDVHLMIMDPIRYIEAFQKAGADLITVHLEACNDVGEALLKIRACGLRAGIAISPDTPVSKAGPYLDQVDMVLIMSVYPGFGGQAFLPKSPDRIREARAMLDERGLTADIEVDGGIYLSNVEEVIQAGANVIVSGSGIFKGDAAENTEKMMEILRRYE